jgi:hypothetical protein
MVMKVKLTYGLHAERLCSFEVPASESTESGESSRRNSLSEVIEKYGFVRLDPISPAS